MFSKEKIDGLVCEQAMWNKTYNSKVRPFFIVISASIVCLAPSVSFYLHVSQTNYSFRMPIFRKSLG